ncbi:MAG: YraN family protein [Treponema sp.]
MSDKRKRIGKRGEEDACAYLEQNGYSIVCRNFRTAGGEIDIIAEREATLVFAEVKTLPCGNPEVLSRVVDAAKQKRIIETSKCFLANNRKYNNNYVRFDVIAIHVPGLPDVYHIENAFTELL